MALIKGTLCEEYSVFCNGVFLGHEGLLLAKK